MVVGGLLQDGYCIHIMYISESTLLKSRTKDTHVCLCWALYKKESRSLFPILQNEQTLMLQCLLDNVKKRKEIGRYIFPVS